MGKNMFEFKKSVSMKINVDKEQEKQISSKEKIKSACRNKNVIAFDIYYDEQLIGFAMFKIIEQKYLFLWNYAIDKDYQNKHFGTQALKELIEKLKPNYERIITTYKLGNEHAKHIYEKVGFIETEVIDEPDCKEVNMQLL